MDITIDQGNIFRNVEMNVSVIARSMYNTDGNSLYDKVRVQKRDHDLLKQFVRTVKGELTSLMKDFVTGENENAFSISLDGRKSELFESELKELCEEYFVCRITCEWLKLKAVEYAPIYENNSSVIREQIKIKIYHKEMPEMILYGEAE